MRIFSDLTQARLVRFRKMRRAYYSFWVLSVAYIFSLLATLLVNDRPIYFSYQGESYFPIFCHYTEQDFGGQYLTEANYNNLLQNEHFLDKASSIISPPIYQNPLRSHLYLEDAPPHAPSWDHWLGTDESARDVLARLIYGFRNCMSFSLLLTIAIAILGILIGGIQGYAGGLTDLISQRLIEIWASLPFLYVVIIIGSIYERGFFMLVAILALFSWIGLSYYMRAEFLKLKNMNYIRVARALGLSKTRIFFKHILPNGLTPVVTLLPFSLIGGISALTSLDFLGFGLNPPTPSWGELLSQGLKNLHAPWITVSTVCALFITLMLAAFIGEGVREAFDPKGDEK
ncbi:MAG: ABC transporter permease [Planctomycetes bacterium]|nr:ABC transporter permease [Planctomycetota bacterium]